MMLTAAVTSAADADDPGGWTKAKWGMTEAELLAAFPGQAARLDPPDKNTGCRVVIKDFTLSGVNFQVYMMPDPDGRLSSVLLQPAKSDDQTDQLFQDLQNLLVQKYGRPWKTAEGNNAEIQWTFKTSTVTLARTRFPGFTTQLVHVRYAHKDPDLDKM
jgi:hypothetical protein